MSGLAAALDALDRRLHGRLQYWPGPTAFFALVRACSALGDGWMWLLGGAALLGAERPQAALVAAVAMAAAVNIPVVILKAVVRRPRPGHYVENPFLIAAVGGPPACDRFSFPSGHTANAVALATVLARAFPAAAALVFVAALLVGGSRVLLGHHYLSDTVGGGLLGLMAGAAVAAVPLLAL